MINRANVVTMIPTFSVALVLLVISCSEKPKIVQEGPITSQTIVATIDTAKITLGEVLAKYTELTVPGVNTPATLNNALDEVIYRRCAYLGADDYSDYDKKEVGRLVQGRIRDVVIDYMIAQLFLDKVEALPSSIDSTYKANLPSLSTPERRRVTHLLVSTNPKAWQSDGVEVNGLTPEQLNARAKSRAEELYQKVKAGDDLGALAAKYSHDTGSKSKKGDSGLFSRGAMVEPFEQAAFKLPKGGLSAPFKSIYGWHILRVEEIVDSTVTPLDSALRKEIELDLKRDELRRRALKYSDSVSIAAKLTWNESILQKEPDTYDPLDWVLIVNETDTMSAGMLRELELMFRTGGSRGAVTPDVRKQILLKRMPGLALMSAARQLGFLDRDTIKTVAKGMYREEVVNRMYRGRTDANKDLPSDAELRKFYESHIEDYISDKPLHVQQVLLPDSLKAAEVRRQAESGADFEKLASQYNPANPPAKETEFDLGWISDKDVSAEFYGAGWIADVGKFAGPVQTRWGWHVIKVVGHKSMLPFEPARLEVLRAYRADKLAQAQQKWAKHITSGFDIVKFNDILSQVDLSNRDAYFERADSLVRAKKATEAAKSGS